MNLNIFKNVANCTLKTANKVGFKVVEKSPQILVGAGIIGFGVTAIKASQATLKLNDILDETKTNLDLAERADQCNSDDVYSEDDYKKDVTTIYVQGALKVAKLYLPAVTLGAVSAVSILCGYNVIRKRYLGVIAAYSMLDKDYKQYRTRVVDTYGEDVDWRFKNGIEQGKTTISEVGEDGKTHKKTVKVDVVDPEKMPISYARLFNAENSPCVYKVYDKALNAMIVHSQENYANDILRTRGHIFLNEVYDMLGLKHSSAGAIMGWLNKDMYGEDCKGDDYIRFSVKEVYEKNEEGIINQAPSLLIDFNVDGVIFDKIENSEDYDSPGYIKFPEE